MCVNILSRLFELRLFMKAFANNNSVPLTPRNTWESDISQDLMAQGVMNNCGALHNFEMT